jgi:hypothetical protein
MPLNFYPKEEAPKNPEDIPYRQRVGEVGLRAADAHWDKLIAKGMTETPKVRWSNSILEDVEKKEADAGKAANAEVSADPNGGGEKAKEQAAKAAPKEEEAAPAKAAAAPAEGAPVAEAAPALMQINKKDTIGESAYDWSVYKFTDNAIYNPLEDARHYEAPALNGYAAKPWSLAQRNQNKHDISDKNIDEEVVGFVRADKNTLPHQMRRNDAPYPLNGWDNTPPSTIDESLAQRNKKDIGDTNIDEEVVGFVRADKNMMPIPQFARRDTAYPVNGWGNTPPSTVSLNQRATKDIGDKNIDEEVVGMVRADKNMMPIPQFARRDTAYPVNGWANTPPSTVENLAQRATKDIGDTNIDEEVVGFVRADKNMMPIPQFARRDTAYPVNGWANTPPSTVEALAQRKDIAQPGVEPNVYDFVHDKVEALNWERREEPFNNNGYAAATPHWGHSLSQNTDISNKEVRPDVYVTVKRMIDPAAHYRSDKSPADSYQPYVGVQEAYPAGQPKPTQADADAEEFGDESVDVQLSSKFLGSPERVNVLDPIAYQTRANGNTIDGGIQIRRTTFY